MRIGERDQLLVAFKKVLVHPLKMRDECPGGRDLLPRTLLFASMAQDVIRSTVRFAQNVLLQIALSSGLSLCVSRGAPFHAGVVTFVLGRMK